jgi:hypothetical protein
MKYICWEAITSYVEFNGHHFCLTVFGATPVNYKTFDVQSPICQQALMKAFALDDLFGTYALRLYESQFIDPADPSPYSSEHVADQIDDVLEQTGFPIEDDRRQQLIKFQYCLRHRIPMEKYERHKALTDQKGRPGFVYLVQSPTKAYKIGRTQDPKNRMKTFGVQLPFEVRYIALIKTPNMHALEAELHKRYEAQRLNGEWFELDPYDVEYIQSLQGKY